MNRKFGYTCVASEQPRSFLFCVVANVGPGGASRSLAVAYRQGRDTNRKRGRGTREDHAVADIIALIEILSDPANRAPLETERALAEDWYRRSMGNNEPEVDERPSVPDTPQPPFALPNDYCWGWRAEQAQLLPELPWHDDALSEFPFISTCLLLGLLRDDRDSDINTTNSNSVRPGDVQLQPLSTIFRGDCKEYGLIILDISDLDSGVKYGIVASPVHYMADVFYRGQEWSWNPNEDPPPEKEPDTVLHGRRPREPLSIVKWLSDDYISQAMDQRVLGIKKGPLIHRSVLNYIWPRGLENQPKKSSQGVISSISDYFWPKPTTHAKYTIPPGPGWTISDDPPGKEHRDQAIDNLLILTQDPTDIHLDENTIGNFQKLAEFRDQVRRRLEDTPNSLGPSKLSSHILRVAYTGSPHLNWVMFRNLPTSVIAAAIASDDLRSASALSLCVDNLMLEEDEGGLNDLAAVLSKSTGPKQLCFFQGPDRDSDNASAYFWAQLLQRWRSSGDLGWLRDRTIYLTCAFSSSLCSSKLSTPLPTTVSLTPPLIEPFPMMHLFTFVDEKEHRFQKHQNSSSSRYYDNMSNSLLTPERFAIRFLSYLRSVVLGSEKAVLRFAYEDAPSPPIITTSTTDDDDSSLLQSLSPRRFMVSPIPAGHFAPPPEVNVQSRVRVSDIHPGRWVVLMNQPGHSLIDDNDTFIRYAFVRIGQPSDETAPEQQEQQQRSIPVSVSLEVVGGLTEFLRETVSEIDVSTYDKQLEEVEKELHARASTETGKHYIRIGVMDENNALALLDQIL